MKALILSQFKDGKTTIEELLELFQKASSIPIFRHLYERFLQPVIKWTRTKMLNLLRELFHVHVDSAGNVQFAEIDTTALCSFLVEKHQSNYDKLLKMLVL